MPFFACMIIFCLFSILAAAFSMFALVLEKRIKYAEEIKIGSRNFIYFVPSWIYHVSLIVEFLLLGISVSVAFRVSFQNISAAQLPVFISILLLAWVGDLFSGEDDIILKKITQPETERGD